MMRFSDALLNNVSTRAYEPPSDIHSEFSVAQPMKERSWVERADAWLDENGPRYKGYPLLDFHLKVEMKAGDSFGYLARTLDSDEYALRIPIPGEHAVKGVIKQENGEWKLQGSIKISVPTEVPGVSGFVEVETTGKTKIGVSLSPPLKGMEYFVPVEVEAYSFIDPTTMCEGRGIEIRILAITVGGEACVGWGRGMREFGEDVKEGIREFGEDVEEGIRAFPGEVERGIVNWIRTT